jgi:O-antigen/teichoic acid export membrane protein
MGQLVVVVVTPFLTRLVSPADMGLFGTYTTLVAVLSVIVTLGFETAIISSRDEDAQPLVGIASLLTGVFMLASIVVMVLLLSAGVIRGLPGWMPWLIALDTFVANIFVAAQYWYIREQRYKRASLGAFSVNAGRGLLWIAGASLMPGAVALPVGSCGGRIIGLAIIDRLGVVPKALAQIIGSPAVGWATAQRYWKSAIFLMPSAAIEVAFFWLPVLLSSALYGVELGGQVALVQRLLSAPLSLFGRSLSDVYQVQITGHGTAVPERIVRATVKVIGSTLGLAIPGWLILVAFGIPIFTLMFGANWGPAGKIVAILAPLVAFQLCGNVITRLLIEIGHQEVRLFAYLLLLASVLISFSLGYYFQWTIFSTLTAMSATGCAIFAAWIVASIAICRELTKNSQAIGR